MGVRKVSWRAVGPLHVSTGLLVRLFARCLPLAMSELSHKSQCGLRMVTVQYPNCFCQPLASCGRGFSVCSVS